jgi:ABC-2 type transport system ATP-binding protein
MIELGSVSLSIRGKRVLEDCTATIESGMITHLAGANGSGKTSLIRALAGIQRYSGQVRFDGRRLALARDRLYVCWDDAAVFPYLNGFENVRMLVGRPISRADMVEVAPAIADDALLAVPARRLSHGQRKRLHLVAALLSGAEYLVLDEALSGVDAPTVDSVAVALERRMPQATVLVTGHRGDEYADIATRHLELRDGRLA